MLTFTLPLFQKQLYLCQKWIPLYSRFNRVVFVMERVYLCKWRSSIVGTGFYSSIIKLSNAIMEHNHMTTCIEQTLKLVRTNINYRVLVPPPYFFKMIVLCMHLLPVWWISCSILFIWAQPSCKERVKSDIIQNEKNAYSCTRTRNLEISSQTL